MPSCNRLKVKAEMPLLALSVSDHKIKSLLSLVQSMPLPSIPKSDKANAVICELLLLAMYR